MSPKKYESAVCRGSYMLGSACCHCERCEEERAKLAASGKLTPDQRAQMIGADVSHIPDVPAGQNAAVAPMQPGAINDAPKVNVDFAATRESLNQYELEDGTVIRARLILMRVERVVGVYNPDGAPVYVTVWNQVSDVVPGHGTRWDQQQ